MKKVTQVQKAIAIPLIGEIWGWLFFVGALYANQLQNHIDYSVNKYPSAPAPEIVHIGTYLFLVAIAGFALAALKGQSLAIASRKTLGDEHALARAAQRFATLAVVLALVFGAIYAIGNFMSAFGYQTSNAEVPLIRILDVYLPILLATGLVVLVILRAFVFREDEHVDEAKDKRGLTETQRALGLGYAMPIVTTAVAIIIGLIVYDVTKTTLQVWVWVLIQVIVVGGVVQGTRFASKAKQGEPRPPRERRALAAGAAGLNFVLSIIFGAVVSIMAFSYGGTAIDRLTHYPEYDNQGKVIGSDQVTLNPVSVSWAINELLP
ncbi:MAG: hypothetical protein ACKOWI_03855, partial [Rhodoluna sp.]